MNLYRLDYLNDDGSTAEAVVDHLAGRDFLSRHMSAARKAAIQAARAGGRNVQVSRISGGGAMKATLVIDPQGVGHAPAGMVTEHKDDGPCFCSACRAVRKAERA